MVVARWVPLFSLACLLAVGTTAGRKGGKVFQVHGSGTTNPSKCLWLIMGQFMEGSKLPTKLSYRAVGSSTGIKEFIGVNNTEPFSYKNYNDFGSGDIPVPTDQYNALQDKGIEFVTLPFVLGSVGVFLFNMRGEDELDETDAPPVPVNLTGCNLAKIFKRDIVHWDDEEILKDNPALKDMLPYDRFSIHVARRVHGSSSTKSLTAYLHNVCPEVWPEEMIGSTVDWHEDTMPCEGSGGMSNCVKSTPGAIGYMESGHGWSENLIEIQLENKSGRFLTSRRAAESGGIGGATAGIPGRADADFGAVDLLNKEGDFTWPITLMSYVFVRKDLSFLEEPQDQTLLKAFLSALYNPVVIDQCRQFGFSPVPGDVRDLGIAGIDMLKTSENATEWTMEFNTDPGVGQGDYVISAKRRNYVSVEVGNNANDVLDLIDSVNDLRDTTAGSAIQTQTKAAVQASSPATTFTVKDAQNIEAAVVMSAVSIVLWGVTLVGFMGKKMCNL